MGTRYLFFSDWELAPGQVPAARRWSPTGLRACGRKRPRRAEPAQVFRAGARVEQESLSGTHHLSSTPVVKDQEGGMVIHGTDTLKVRC